jgi:hypothetical protein
MVDMCYVTPSYTNKGLLQRAQEEVLPYERRQKITDQKVFSHKVMINNARFLANEHHAKARTLPAAKPPESPALAQESVKKLDTLGEVFELFIDALADRITAKLAAKQPREIPPMTPEDYNKVFEELHPLWKNTPLQPNPMEMLDKLSIRKPPAKKRPTVLVVGLNGCQMETIKTYKPDIDYTFATAEQALSLRTMVKDHTILMTKFINHSVQGKYRKHPNLHYCNGGVSDLKHMLHVIFHKETV